MNRRALKKEMKARRQAMRAQLKSAKARMKEAKLRAKQLQAKPKDPARNRRRLILLIILLLLLLLRECDCGPATPPPPRRGQAQKPPVKVLPAKKPPIRRRLKKKPRPAYEGEKNRKKTWLDDFRLEVAGRSPRLAACFEGAARPGAVKWSAAVDPQTGRVSDQALTPIVASISLTGPQEACLKKVLSEPPYRLSAKDAASTPERLSLVLEF